MPAARNYRRCKGLVPRKRPLLVLFQLTLIVHIHLLSSCCNRGMLLTAAVDGNCFGHWLLLRPRFWSCTVLCWLRLNCSWPKASSSLWRLWLSQHLLLSGHPPHYQTGNSTHIVRWLGCNLWRHRCCRLERSVSRGRAKRRIHCWLLARRVSSHGKRKTWTQLEARCGSFKRRSRRNSLHAAPPTVSPWRHRLQPGTLCLMSMLASPDGRNF
mmetsp:Transcript_50472/g.163363  ORF Transcript_50472/g.163363 Transcript_50472/m.163363 type:complete len:212 (+) Transcript_50472:155-790(+)